MSVGKLIAVSLIFGAATIGWAILGGITQLRTGQASQNLGGEVANLWGTAQVQTAPSVAYRYTTQEQTTDPQTKKKVPREAEAWNPVQLSGSDLRTSFQLDY